MLSLIAHYKQFPPPTYGWRKNDCLTVTAGLTDRLKQSLSSHIGMTPVANKRLAFFMPSLGMLTINALAAADSVLVPAQPQFLSAKGLEQLLQTVNKVRRQINRNLRIDGILLTMADNRTNYSKEVGALLRSTYGSKVKVFDTEIPRSVRAAEISAEGKSIYAHDPHGKVSEAYRSLTGEVLKLEKQREKHKSDLSR